jgi:hypothetical protein
MAPFVNQYTLVYQHSRNTCWGHLGDSLETMGKRSITAGLVLTALIGLSAFGQDWYRERAERYRGDRWRSHVFLEVRSDLDHVRSAFHASDKERRRLERTREELTELQASLDAGRWDNGHLNDVIDSLTKSADDDRLSPRDREILRDDVMRLKDYQEHHNNWRR